MRDTLKQFRCMLVVGAVVLTACFAVPAHTAEAASMSGMVKSAWTKVTRPVATLLASAHQFMARLLPRSEQPVQMIYTPSAPPPDAHDDRGAGGAAPAVAVTATHETELTRIRELVERKEVLIAGRHGSARRSPGIACAYRCRA